MATSSLAPELLELLVCPATHQKLKLATDEQLSRINELIKAEAIATASGKLFTARLTEVLLTEDETYAYVIRDGIAQMLPDEALCTATLL